MTPDIFIPYMAVALTIVLQGIILIYVPPNAYKRVCALPVILFPIAIVYFTAQNASPVGPWNIFIGLEFGSLLGLEVFDNVCLSKISYAAATEAGDAKKHDDSDSTHIHAVSTWKHFYDKVRWSLDIAINKRRINHVDQTRNIPYFDSNRPHHIPSRRSFLLFRTARFTLLYLALDLITSQPLEDAQVKFAPGKERIFARIMAKDISPPEVGEALGMIMAHGICAYSSLLLGYDFLSLVAVGLCEGKVSDWRPLFGDIREVYNIRTFWRKFWHQLLLRPLESNASFITHTILRLPRFTRSPTSITNADSNGKSHAVPTQPQPQDKLIFLVTAYIKLFFIFLISGVAHIASDRILGIPFRDSRCISLFLCQAWGILFEDAVKWMYRYATGTKGDGPPKLWHRLVGYSWLVVFALWAAPAWVFSILRLEVEPVVLPVAIFPRG